MVHMVRMVHVWYRWYSRILDSRHLGVIMNANQLNWYMRFKWENFGYIIDIVNFAVVYTPTSIEVGKCIIAKFALVDFDSSNISSICLTTSQLVVALHLYSVLLVV